MSTDYKSYLNDKFINLLESNNLPKLIDFRKDSFNEFISKGFPTLKHEDWKYTNVGFMNKHSFEIADNAYFDSDIDSLSLIHNPLARIVFINGFISEQHTSFNSDIISIKRIKDLNDNDLKNINIVSEKNNSFTNLNNSFFNDLIYIEIKKGAIIEQAIEIINIYKSDKKLIGFPRIYVNALDSSESKILINNKSFAEIPQVSNMVIEVYCHQNAKLEFSQLHMDDSELYQFTTFKAIQEKDSVLNHISFYLDGKFVRNNTNVSIQGQNAENHLFGYYYASGNNFIDNHTFVDHAVANSNSNEVYKGIITDNATAVFNGKILVRRDAQKTNAYQSNKNILMTDNATINTKPELEIYADDVKCSHGATSGSIDEDALFYLRARGISEDTAKSLLILAFGEDITNKVSIPEVQEYLLTAIHNRLNL